MNKVLGNKWSILVFCTPAGILLFSLVYYPIVNIFRLAMYKSDGVSVNDFIGLKNFVQLLNDGYFLRANWRSLFMAVFATLGIAALGTVIAFITSGLAPGVQSFYKTSYLIPFFLSISVIAQLWLSIYHAQWGILNTLLEKLGLSIFRTSWLTNNKTAVVCIALVGMWWVLGMTILLVYTGIQAVPVSLYEAARIDGANFWQISRYITYPICKNVIKLCITINTIGGFYCFPQVYVMTRGGPGDMTMTVMMLIYREAFSNLRVGLSCSMAAISILESVVILVIINLLMHDPKIDY
jgi:ABC-type sugar transport system permease subunit